MHRHTSIRVHPADMLSIRAGQGSSSCTCGGDRQATAGADPALAARAGTQVGVQTQSAEAVQGPGTEGGGPAPGDGRAITASAAARRDSIRIQGARAEGPSRGSPAPVMRPRSRVRVRCVLRGRDCAGCAA